LAGWLVGWLADWVGVEGCSGSGTFACFGLMVAG
jgi:hypothetical protein